MGSNRLNYSGSEAKAIQYEECLCHFMRNYTYTDSDALGGKYYFKLKVVLISQSLNSPQRVRLHTPNNVNFFKESVQALNCTA